MRPEKARRVINHTIARYLDDEPTAIYIPDMLKALKKMYCKQIIWHKNRGYDFSSMYDYIPNAEKDYQSVKRELEYISDRWDAPHRLQWMITGIEEHKF